MNPLKPHYYCPQCHHFEDAPDGKDGYDLPEKSCPVCKAAMERDGRLFAVLLNTEAGSRTDAELFPLGENTFGIRQDMDEIVFSDKGVAFSDEPCRKL